MKKIYYLSLLLTISISSQPKPGDVFRDYYWTTGDYKQSFLRVIGDGDYREPVNFSICYPEDKIKDGWINLGHSVDLENAVRAEVQVEKLLSHDGTKNLALKVNESKWYKFAESEYIPEPQYNYLYHTYPSVEIPLNSIREGIENQLRFKVDSTQRFGMPQNILYGFCLRVYYDENKTDIDAKIIGIENNTISENQSLELAQISGEISKVNYVGFYEDINYQTDGNYRQWHYTFYRGEIKHNIANSETTPFKVQWNTSWIPDQNEVIQVSAIIEDQNGIKKFIEPITDLSFERDYNVLLCKPFNQPTLWATREGEFTEAFNCSRNPQDASSFRLVWSSWSPGYMNGLYLNDWIVFTHEGNNYTPGFHIVESEKCHMLNWGTNIVKTGKTPKINGNMVHGTEILYPGIMALVKFENSKGKK